MACLTCQNFRGFDFLKGRTVAVLDSTATAGCPYCNLIKQCLHGMFHVEDIRSFMIIRSGALGMTIDINLQLGYQPKDSRVGPLHDICHESIEFFISPGQETPGDWVQPYWPVPDNPNSDESFAFVSDCLQQCLTEHPKDLCMAPPLQRIFPTRIVELVGATIKITTYQEKLGPYLALSHCWGGAVPSTLTLSSTDLFQSIDFEALPNTFRDAIKLTKRLGYSYIWIDSLCIYQDIKRDWEEEASKMGDIYRNAVLTIAAGSSKSCDVSFLSPRPRIMPPTVDLIFTDQNTKSYSLKALRRLDYHENEHSESGPLYQRAWCFQEYHLSRRVISYNNTEITFKCRFESTCQCQRQSFEVPDSSRVLFQPEIFSKAEILQTWFTILMYYSARELTVDTDRLTALSGIASIIHKATGWTYVGGLWSEKALECLCWLNPASCSSKPSSSRIPIAPTFSWASISGQAFCDNPLALKSALKSDNQITIHSVVIGFNYSVLGRNPFGNVAPSTFIELEGPVLEARLVFGGNDCFAVHDSCTWRMYPDTPLNVVAVGNQSIVARCDEMDSFEELNGLPVWILIIATSRYNYHHADAIALRKLQSHGEVFERIGMMNYVSQGIRDVTNRNRQAHEIILDLLQQARRRRLKIY